MKSAKSKLIDKATETILHNEAFADGVVRQLLGLYDEAAYQVEGSISALTGRFAADNNLSRELAQQMLEGKEASSWRMSIERYLEQLPAAGKGSKLELELNLLAAKSRISREERLLGEIYKNIANMAGDCDELLGDALAEIYRVNYNRGMYNLQSSFGLGFNVAKIDETALRRLLEYPWQTKNFSANIWGKGDAIANTLRRELTMGFIQGSSVQKMSREVRNVFDVSRYQAERLVRTECKFFANQGELEGYKANGISKYRFVGGSEGSHNCTCGELNGQEFLVSEALAGTNYPPIHPNCLCIVVAVFERSMFDAPTKTRPLKNNPNFAKWLKQYGV